jgi:hypothetical protein
MGALFYPSKTHLKLMLLLTNNELSDNIVNLTMTIDKHYPELSGFLNEMPTEYPETIGRHVSTLNLKLYYDSLSALLRNYNVYHAAPVNTYVRFANKQ